MKVALISTTKNGGAGEACKRLKLGLEKLHLKVSFVYRMEAYDINWWNTFKTYFKKRKVIKNAFSVLNNTFKRVDYFSFPYSYYTPEKNNNVLKADVVNIHWVSDFVNFKSFFKSTRHIPMVITLHDMNYFTGGCHYSFGCSNFVKMQCGDCWQLEGSKVPNASKEAFFEKLKAYNWRKPENTFIVSPSFWLQKESQKSELLAKYPHYVIHNGIDTSVFNCINKELARKTIQLPIKDRILLFIASDIKLFRKGFQFVNELLPYLSNIGVKLMVVGDLNGITIEGENIINIGKVDNSQYLSMCYSSVDAMLLPTLADNLPNTMLESICCGTPVLGFEIGGLPDVIINGQNGYLSSRLDAFGLKEIITTFFEKGVVKTTIEIRNDAVLKYNLEVQAKAYNQLFESILENKTNS